MKTRRQIEWRGDRGEGSVFFIIEAESGKKVSPNLYLAYQAGRKDVLVSAKTSDLAAAKKRLRALTRNAANAADGKEALVLPKASRVTVADVLDANLQRAEEADLATLAEYRYWTEMLKAMLGSVRAVDFSAQHVASYKRRRQEGEGTKRGKKAGLASLKLELQVLRKAFKHAAKVKLIPTAPEIEVPKYDRVRDVLFPREKVAPVLFAMRAAGAEDEADLAEWVFLTGMRPGGRAGTAALRWTWYDPETETLRVPSQKGGQSRTYSVEDGLLAEVFKRRLGRRDSSCPFIFHQGGKALTSRRLADTFGRALKAIGMKKGRKEGFTPYDLKKTALTLMIRAGVSQTDAMISSGHRTISTFERYNIKDAETHRRSMRLRDEYLASLPEKTSDFRETLADSRAN